MTAGLTDHGEVYTSPTSVVNFLNVTVDDEPGGSSNSGQLCDKCSRIADVIVGLLGVMGNLLVIIVLFYNKGVRNKVTNILIVNQSLLDLVAASLQSIYNIVRLSHKMEFTFRGAELVCRTFYNQVFMWDALVGSTYNLILLNLDRYFQIVHPITHKVSFTPRRAKMLAVAVWFIGPTINMYAFFTSGVRGSRCVMNSFWPEPWMSKMVGLVKLFLQFFLPVFVMVFSYVRMILVIRGRASVTAVMAQPAAGTAAQSAANLAKQRKNASIQHNIFKTLALVTVCFVLCWCWNQVFILLFNLDYPVHFNTVFYRFSNFMVLLNCSCNPIIYTFSFEPFRKGLKALILGREASATFGVDSLDTATKHT